jgi:hypothetical protein
MFWELSDMSHVVSIISSAADLAVREILVNLVSISHFKMN